MRKRLHQPISFLVCVQLICFFGVNASAQAILGSENCKSISPGGSFNVVAETDSLLDRSVKDYVAAAFESQGMRLHTKPILRILYRSEIEQIRHSSSKTGMVETQSKSWAGNEVFVHLWRSKSDSVLGGKKGGRTNQILATYLRFVVEVSDINDSSCVWRGRAIAKLEKRRKRDLIRQMIPPLIKTFGRTVARENIVLR